MESATARGKANGANQVLAWSAAIIVALVLNLLFFGLMPGLLSRVPPQKSTQTMTAPLQVTHVDPPEPERPRPRTPNEARTSVQRPTQAAPDYVSPDVPRPDIAPLPLELNPALPPTSVSLPAPEFAAVTLPAIQFEGPYELADLDTPPRVISQIEPEYPLRAMRMGIEGTVVVRFLLTKNGEIRNVEIVSAEPKGVFEASTLRFIKNGLKMTAGKIGPKPVDHWVKQPVHFQLGN